MAARLTDRQKKKIVADYLEMGSYRAAARENGVSADSVKRAVGQSDGFEQKAAQKKQQNTQDILEYMDRQRDIVCQIIGKGLEALNAPGKLEEASPTQITTALGTLIDKWALKPAAADAPGAREDDPITQALKGKYGDAVR